MNKYIYAHLARRQGKSFFASRVNSTELEQRVAASYIFHHPLVDYSEFRWIGRLQGSGAHCYQLHNKMVSLVTRESSPVPTVEGMWYQSIGYCMDKMRQDAPPPVLPCPQGNAIFWLRRHRQADLIQACAAMLMLADLVVLVRSFSDEGEQSWVRR